MQRAFWSIICFFIFINCKINAEITNRHSHSLVYVHIGPDLPSYLPIAIAQARLFNPDTPIYLIANSSAMSNYDCEDQKIHLVPIELLIPTKSHKKFKDRAKSNGFWRYTLERFLYLDDFIQQYKLNNVFHAENDVMIYFNLEEKLHVFQECYPKMIATTFDCDERSVPSFVYISDPMPSKQFAKYIAINGLNGANDMSLLFDFKEKYYKKFGDHLPILIPAYVENRSLINLANRTAKNVAPFINNIEKFQLIFDAAAIGQFLGGIDPILGNKGPGFIAELSVFLTHHCTYQWKMDEKRRWVPHISYGGVTYPIANLHIHCKNLRAFYSLNQNFYPLPTQVWSSLPFERSCYYEILESVK